MTIGLKKYAGIHLSGVNAHKTAVVISSINSHLSSLRVERVYEKIGSFGNHFSDERLFEILSIEGELGGVVIDCPLTLPPCVSCERPVCPGVSKCEDISVAYMASLVRNKKFKRSKRYRPINPQVQRLYDVWQLAQKEDSTGLEPTFSSNLAPLVVRARTLQRRLNVSAPKAIKLQETSVPYSLEQMAISFGLEREIKQSFKNFEMGLEIRRKILEQLKKFYWLDAAFFKSENYDLTLSSVENFQALISSLLAVLNSYGLCRLRPANFPQHEGWALIPNLASDLPTEKRERLMHSEVSNEPKYYS